MEASIPSELILTWENGEPILDAEKLNDMLLKEEVADSKVMVISTTGPAKGKTLLTSISKRYLTHMQKYGSEQRSKTDCWLDENIPVREFPWNPSGSEGNIPGIRLSVTKFPSSSPSEEKVQSTIIFLDPQGITEDENTNLTVNAIISSLSSILLYNVSQNLSEYDLKQLEKFTELATKLPYDTGDKPFQNLVFLLRDWYRRTEAEPGLTGGQTILKKKWQVDKKKYPEKESVRNHTDACFAKVMCFLMPHPGLRITSHEFDGDVSDMEADFKVALKQLIPFLLHPKNAAFKTIRGEEITVRRWVVDFKAFVEHFKLNYVSLEPISLNAQELCKTDTLISALSAGNNIFRQGMAASFKTSLDDDQLRKEFTILKQQAIEEFRKKCGPNMDPHDIQVQKYKNNLLQDIQYVYDLFESVHEENKQKTVSLSSSSSTKSVAENKERKNIIVPKLFARIPLTVHPHTNLMNMTGYYYIHG